VLSGRGLCDELITRPEKSYRLWRVVVCDLETTKEEAKSPLKGCEYKPTMDCEAERKKTYTHIRYYNVAMRFKINILYQRELFRIAGHM